MRNSIVKSVRNLIVGSIAFFMFKPAIAQNSIVLGGINTTKMETSKDVLRAIISQSIIKNSSYILMDRFDVAEKVNKDSLDLCLGQQCLIELGQTLNADFALSASYEKTDDRIIVTMKLVDVKNAKVLKTEIRQFENQEVELTKITDMMLQYLNEKPIDELDEKMLIFKNLPANSISLQQIDNSGPRMGFAIVTGANGDYLQRSTASGGLGGSNVTYNIGYQFEKQYVGNERFSGIFEFIFNFAGLERSKIFPSLAILHGLRFGKGTWEVAVGPSLTTRRLAKTIQFNGQTMTRDDYYNTIEPALPNENQKPSFDSYQITKRPDARGDVEFGTNFVVGVGKTFKSGSLNIPLNFYASMSKFGTSYGISIGINLMKTKTDRAKSVTTTRNNNGYVKGSNYRTTNSKTTQPTIIIRQ